MSQCPEGMVSDALGNSDLDEFGLSFEAQTSPGVKAGLPRNPIGQGIHFDDQCEPVIADDAQRRWMVRYGLRTARSLLPILFDVTEHNAESRRKP